MKFYIDFEATQASEIISIGCVAETGATFQSLVKPHFSSISPYISQLTHITNEMLENENDLDFVFNRMYDWITSLCPSILDWEFLAYGSDEDFVKASLPNIYTEHSMILAAMMIAKMRNGAKEAKSFFHGTISLIHAFNHVENAKREQRHDPLEDAIMFQKVYEYMQENEPLEEHPLHRAINVPVDYKSPSGKFYCKAGGKNAKEREFETCEEAITWLINTVMRPKEPEKVHRERIMTNIMKAVRGKSMYCGYKWRRVKEDEVAA